MNRIRKHMPLKLLLAAFLGAHAQGNLQGQTLTAPHPALSGSLDLTTPLTVPGANYTTSKTVSFLFTHKTLTFDVKPTVMVSGDVLDLQCPGTANLQLTDCGEKETVWLNADNPGTASMNFAMKLALTGTLSLNGSSIPIPFNPPQTVNFSASQPLSDYGFTPTTLSATQSPQVLSLHALSGWVASIDLEMSATINPIEKVSAVNISTSAGDIVQYGQLLGPANAPGACAYSLKNIQEQWTDAITVNTALTTSLNVSVLGGLISFTIDTGSVQLAAETFTYPVSSAILGPVSFPFVYYTVIPTSNAGGSISPDITIAACSGTCIPYVATPDPGYYVCGWYVNGVLVQRGGTTYTYVVPGAPGSNNNTTTVQVDFCMPAHINPNGSSGNATALAVNLAQVSGSANPGGSAAAYWFEYGEDESYGNSTEAISIGSGTNDVVVSNLLTDLTANTTYHYQLVVSNATDYAYGGDQTVTTFASYPTLAAGSVGGLTSTTALLSGSVNPGGLPTIAWFEYGPTTNYEDTSTNASFAFEDGNDDAVSILLTNLPEAASYHYRLVASNSLGEVFTPDQEFVTTGTLPDISLDSITGITPNSATLGAIINANGLDTSVFFLWGDTTNYGNTVPDTPSICGNGSSNILTGITLAGLSASSTYHVQLVASNAAGSVFGPDMILTTEDPEQAYLGSPSFVSGEGGLQFDVWATAGQSYTLQWSTNLGGSNWTTLTNLAITNVMQSFIDPLPPVPQRFYRAVLSTNQDLAASLQPGSAESALGVRKH